MAKPIIEKISPVDANKQPFNISTIYSGQIPKYRQYKIYSADTNTEIYTSNKIENSSTKIIDVNCNLLRNGRKYAISIQFTDSLGNTSAWSDKTYFLTLETPTFILTDGINNLSTTGVNTIKNSSFNVFLKYQQTNNEELYNYQFFLYDNDYKLLSKSDMIYEYDSDNSSYRFSGFDNRKTYYLKAKGLTKSELELDTGFINIFIDFDHPSAYAKIYAESDDNATVNGYTNIALIEPDDPDINNYDANDNGFVTLTNRDMTYSSNFNIAGDFVLIIRAKNMIQNSKILSLKNDDYEMYLENFMYSISSHSATNTDTTQNYNVLKLTVPNIVEDYILFKTKDINDNLLKFGAGDIITICIRRVGRLYELYVSSEPNNNHLDSMWFGLTIPGKNVEGKNIYDIFINGYTDPAVLVESDDVVVYYQNSEPTNNSSNITYDPKTGITSNTTEFAKYQVWIGGNE